jgi:hypothetical protein
MRIAHCIAAVAIFLFPTASALTQANTAARFPTPTTKAGVPAFDIAIVKRAAGLIATPEQWNHHDDGRCFPSAATFSLACALKRGIEEAAGLPRVQPPGAPAPSKLPVACRMRIAETVGEGSCGTLFDEIPIFTISHVAAVTTGRWRSDVQPLEVWSGTMADAESPVEFEARQAISAATTKKYNGRLVDYNNDSTTTFADIKALFHAIEQRVSEKGSADLGESGEDVEIEIYAGARGVIRTYNGWFAVSGFSVADSTMRFQIDTLTEIPPNDVDREILRRAALVISSDSVWNRADNRKCPADAKTWSIYCAVERATIEVTGGFHHRRPAMELVREIVEARSKGKSYQHRAMGYNNDPSTTLADIRSVFDEAIARIKK